MGTPLDWQRVKRLFHSALERDPATVGNYLDQACDGDADLRREVDSLIAVHGRVGTFIEVPVGIREPASAGGDGQAVLAGLRMGPYELIEMLGAGGMGEVYMARDPRLGRKVALKVLPAALVADHDRRERFLGEARMVSALNHPNICTIYEIGSADGRDYICFEYIEGVTLATLLEGPPLSVERVLELSVPLADALTYAHAKGILHRDLKPANIMVSDRGPKILDFGLAKVVAATGSAPDSNPSLSDAGLVVGTVAYMSPEQALGRKVDGRSDIFSFGAVLYEMASGNQAFTGNAPAEVLDAVLHREPVPLARLRPALPADLSTVVEKALRKETAERYQHMGDLATDVRRLSEGEPALIAGRRRRIARAAILVALALSALCGLIVLGRWRGTSPPTESDSLAVMYFENLSDRADADNLGRMLAGLVTTDLAASESLQVVSTQRIFDITRQLGRAEGEPDRTVATDVARRAGAARMVLGQVTRAGPRIVATAELVQVNTGRRLASYRAEGSRPQDVFSIAEELGAHLRANMTGRPPQPSSGISLTSQLTTSAEAYRAYVRGEVFLHRWELEKGADEFRQAVKLDPEFALAHYRLSTLPSIRSGSLSEPEALAAAARAYALKERLPLRYRAVVEGNHLLMTGRITKAIPLLETALARDRDNKELLYVLSECYMHSSRDTDPRRAAELMERILALDPEFHLVYGHLAVAYALLGEFGKAHQKLDGWDSKEPETVRVTRSYVLALEGRLGEALLWSEPLEGPVLQGYTRGYFGLAAGRWDVSQAMIRKYKDLPLLEACLRINLGQFEQARSVLRRFLPARLEADDGVFGGIKAIAIQLLASLAELRGDPQSALREAERALEIQPEGPFCLYFAGLYAIRAGNMPAAERYLRTLEEVMKVARGPLVHLYRDALMAEVALARGRASDARPLLENAVGSHKLSFEFLTGTLPGPAFRDGLARTYLAAGEKTKAAEALQGLVDSGYEGYTDPARRARGLYKLGILRLELGDRLGGREMLRKFLGQWGKADWDLAEVRDARARLASATATSSP